MEGKQLEERDFLQDNKICEVIIEKVEELLVNIRVKNKKTQAIDHKYLLTETDDQLRDEKTKTKSEKMYKWYQINGWSAQKKRNSKASRARIMWIVFWFIFPSHGNDVCTINTVCYLLLCELMVH